MLQQEDNQAYLRSMMAMPLDFHHTGNRWQALSTLATIYPAYSSARTLLKFINALNQIGPRISPRNLNISEIEGALPPASQYGQRAFLTHKLHQNGRLYIFDHSEKTRIEVVTKIAFNERAARGIRREFQTLNSLIERTTFNIPKVLNFKDWAYGCALSVSAVPREHKPRRKKDKIPDAIFEEIASLRPKNLPYEIPANAIEGWETALIHARSQTLFNLARSIDPRSNYRVCAAHRDLGSENIFCRKFAGSAEDFTVIDWEYFTESAPALTDRVGVWLGKHHRLLKGWRLRNNALLVKEFLADFSDAPGGQDAAVLALLHLAELGIDLARILTQDSRGSQ